MAIRKILTVPDSRLTRIARPIRAVTDDTRKLMDDMLETMYASNGIGLAAVQIGVLQRVIVMDLGGENRYTDNGSAEKTRPEPRYFVNPELLWQSKDTSNFAEGCLSVPGFFEDVERPSRCRVRFLDYHGQQQELDCDGLLATCIQHEIDHLNGIVFITHLSRLKRDRIVKKLTKQARSPAQSAA